MTRGAFYGLFAMVALASGAFIFQRTRNRSPEATAVMASSAAASGSAAPELIAVEAIQVAPRPFVSETSAVGSLLSNEAVTLVAELPRRLLRVSAQEGTRVKKGQILFQLDDADLRASFRELVVKKKLAKAQATREKKMVAEGVTSVAVAEKAIADLELVEAQLATLAVSLSKTTVRAPFDGLLGLRLVSEGALVGVSTPLITLLDDSKIKVDFSLPERYQDLVSLGQKISFLIEGRAQEYEATVAAIEPNIDPVSRSMKLRAVLPNPDHRLRAGSFVSVQVPISSSQGALFVPSTSVIPTLGGHSLFVIGASGKVARVEVKLGVRLEDQVQIVKGLAPGDIVATNQLLKLKDGMLVKIGRIRQADAGGMPEQLPAASASAKP